MDGLEHGSRCREDRDATNFTTRRRPLPIPTTPTDQQFGGESAHHGQSRDLLKPATRPFTWHQFLGLPYKLKADPLDGIGADCILLTLRILEAGGLPRPAAQAWWYRAFRRGEMALFDAAFANLTIPIGVPEQYALTIFQEPPNRGFGIVVDGGLVTALPERGVCWTPLSALAPRTFYRLAA